MPLLPPITVLLVGHLLNTTPPVLLVDDFLPAPPVQYVAVVTTPAECFDAAVSLYFGELVTPRTGERNAESNRPKWATKLLVLWDYG